MPRETRSAFFKELGSRYGAMNRIAGSQSLFQAASGAFRVYVRYSKVHAGSRTFYGLRDSDLRSLQGHLSMVVFLWDDQVEPLFLAYDEFEEVFGATSPAGDGQYKVQVQFRSDTTELYVARAGRFNVEAHFGWHTLAARLDAAAAKPIPLLSHSQVQTLLAAIGSKKDYDVWIPMYDRAKLDPSVAPLFECRNALPSGYGSASAALQEVDVVWLRRGSNEVQALFEVEHTTTIYSALLRFNDIHLVLPALRPTFTVVANEARRGLFLRQLARPTFKTSGLTELCSFLEYANVFTWHSRLGTP